MEHPGGDIKKEARKEVISITVDQIKEPICMIPDLGNISSGAYFMVTGREEWADEFDRWLHVNDTDQEKLTLDE